MSTEVETSLHGRIVRQFIDQQAEMLRDFCLANGLDADRAAGLLMVSAGFILRGLRVEINATNSISDDLGPLMEGYRIAARELSKAEQ